MSVFFSHEGTKIGMSRGVFFVFSHFRDSGFCEAGHNTKYQGGEAA
jgi:hypothetical protein